VHGSVGRLAQTWAAQPHVDGCVAQRPSDYPSAQPGILFEAVESLDNYFSHAISVLKQTDAVVAVASLSLHLLEFRKPNLAPASVGAFI